MRSARLLYSPHTYTCDDQEYVPSLIYLMETSSELRNRPTSMYNDRVADKVHTLKFHEMDCGGYHDRNRSNLSQKLVQNGFWSHQVDNL